MSQSWSQADTKQTVIPAFVEKARALKPVLHRLTIAPVHTTMKGETLHPDEKKNAEMGRGDKVVFDFGNHFVGYLTLRLDLRGGPMDAPALIKIKMCEVSRELDEDSSEYDGWIGKGWLQEEWLHVDELPITLRLPRRYALRFLKLEVLDTSPNYKLACSEIQLESVTSMGDTIAVPLKTEMQIDRDIDQVCLQTLRGCMQEVFEDGPKRDRRLWIGDLRLQAQVNAVTCQNFDLVKRCLYLFAGMIRKDGAIASCVYAEPRMTADHIFLLDYSLLFVPTLLDYYRATHDMETLKELAPSALTQLELAQRYITEQGVLAPEGEYCCFIDWKEGLHKQTAMCGVYLYRLKNGCELYRILGDEEMSISLSERFEHGSQAVKKEFWDHDLRLFVSGSQKQISFASQIWMCLAGVVEGSEAAALFKRVNRRGDAIGMSTPYLYHHYITALIECGETESALHDIRSYWGGMLKEGADTFWELYDPKTPFTSPYGSSMANSYCHAWSCTPAVLLRMLNETSH